MVQGDVIADLGSLANHYAHAMVDKETPADGRARMDLDAGQPATERRNKARQHLPVALPQPMRQAVKQYRVQARVVEQHLKAVACRRVAMKYRLDILANALEHVCVLLKKYQPVGAPVPARIPNLERRFRREFAARGPLLRVFVKPLFD